LLGVDDDQIDEHAGNLHLFGRQGGAPGQALDLDHHDAAGTPRRLGHGQHLAEHGLLFHADVAVLVGRGAAQERDVDVEGLVEQPLAAGQGDDVDQIVAGRGALAPTAVARIDEGVQADLGDQPGSPRSHLAHQLRQRALGKVVRLDGVGDGHVGDRRRIDEGSGDDPLQQVAMREMTDPLGGLVAEPHGVETGERPRSSFAQEPIPEGQNQPFGDRVAAPGAADQ
jgi:hypothetical protein